MTPTQNNIANQPANLQQSQGNAELLKFKELFFLCLANWYWFVISVVVIVAAAAFYLHRCVPLYERSAKVLIKTETKGGSAADFDFSDLGLVSSNTKVTNEVSAFSSTSNMREVVRRLNLETSCTIDGSGHRELLYARTLPVLVTADALGENESVSFTVRTDGVAKLSLSEFVLNGEKVKGTTAEGLLGETIATPAGPVSIRPSTAYEGHLPETFYVSRRSLQSTATSFSRHLTVSNNARDRSDVITLTLQDTNIQRAEDILNTLIAVYNENWIKDKNQIAHSTSVFIDERLAVIENELAGVDSDISTYKSEQLVPDVNAAASLYMNQNSTIDAQLQQLTNQLSMARYIRNYLASDSDPGHLLPANSGINNSGIEAQISAYNNKVLQRNELLANSGTANPLVIDANNALDGMRANIVSSVDNLVTSLEEQIANLQRSARRNTSRIAANPTQAKHLLGVERQQSVKEALYLFLLQKREENELSQAFTAYNTRIIDPPTGSMLPISPARHSTLILAFLIGLFLPAIVISLIQRFNTTVRGRDDLKKLTLPFLGEIPFSGDRRNNLPGRLRRILDKKPVNTHPVLVEKGNRDVINEAFRVLRTNLEFMTQSEPHCVLAITSFNPGSGKSFISMNLAVSLAIRDKRVLVIDGDLRHASQSQYMRPTKVGFADYLAHRTDDLAGIIQQSQNTPTLFALPVGTIPPNPTELVSDPRFEEAILKLKADYDFVIIDCPPVEIVADTQIIERCCDRTLFVVRAGLLDRAMLPELEALYQDGKLKNMSMILNGSSSASSGRYGYRYGYKYGYHAGSHGYYGADHKD
jgi:capsular exopolysaccharide synthesis family protein